jgi:hypothetical protein
MVTLLASNAGLTWLNRYSGEQALSTESSNKKDTYFIIAI